MINASSLAWFNLAAGASCNRLSTAPAGIHWSFANHPFNYEEYLGGHGIDMHERALNVPVGDETTSALWQAADGPMADCILILGHGASTNREHPTMARLAGTLLSHGLSVVRFNFLYMEKKKGPPDRMPRLIECFSAVVEHVRKEAAPRKIIIGGHSMGGRAASMMAAERFPCDGLLLLSYPLHPAGQPANLRDAHLPQIAVPTLCLNGTRDELCQQDLMRSVVTRLPSTFTMHWLEAADHGYHVQKRSGRTDEEVLAEVGDVTERWVRSALLV